MGARAGPVYGLGTAVGPPLGGPARGKLNDVVFTLNYS